MLLFELPYQNIGKLLQSTFRLLKILWHIILVYFIRVQDVSAIYRQSDRPLA